ncbi:hypothetical protein KDL29_09600 [bacterium]|nr:hypothetical protein [bacterium]
MTRTRVTGLMALLACLLAGGVAMAQDDPLQLKWSLPAAAGESSVVVGNKGGLYVKDVNLGISHYDATGQLIWHADWLRWNIAWRCYEFPGFTIFTGMGGQAWAVDRQGQPAWEFYPEPWKALEHLPGPDAAPAVVRTSDGRFDYGLDSSGGLCWMSDNGELYDTWLDPFDPQQLALDLLWMYRTPDRELLWLDSQGIKHSINGPEGTRWGDHAAVLPDGRMLVYGDDGRMQLLDQQLSFSLESSMHTESLDSGGFKDFQFGTGNIGWGGRRWGRVFGLLDDSLVVHSDTLDLPGQVLDVVQSGTRVLLLGSTPLADGQAAGTALEGLPAAGELPAGKDGSAFVNDIIMLEVSDDRIAWQQSLFGPVLSEDYHMSAIAGGGIVVWHARQGVWVYGLEAGL